MLEIGKGRYSLTHRTSMQEEGGTKIIVTRSDKRWRTNFKGGFGTTHRPATRIEGKTSLTLGEGFGRLGQQTGEKHLRERTIAANSEKKLQARKPLRAA